MDIIKRIDEAIDDAELAFWSVIADKFPECRTGDASPEEVMELWNAHKKAVGAWIIQNWGES